jgi:D-psicose/D-tagatose/L-ribulose 3-epimerase
MAAGVFMKTDAERGKNSYPFPLSVQTVLPADYPQNRSFQSELKVLRQLGFEGVELNIAAPEKENIAAIRRFLDHYELRLTMFATGLTAKTRSLSLSSSDEQVRRKSIQQCKAMIDFVTGEDTGIIVGFLKGGPDGDTQGAHSRFSDSLGQIAPHAAAKRVRVLIEATNRYESAVANDLAAAVDLIKPWETPFLQVLPDTFHMNIEEAQGTAAALASWTGHYPSVHLSDNNRLFPGLGAIDFKKILSTLKQIGYTGTLAIEGNIRKSFIEDIQASATFLASLI